MTPRQKKIVQEIPTWVYRAIIGVMVSIIMFFVINIHEDFEREKEKVQQHELKLQDLNYRTGVLETTVKQRTF